MSDLCDYGYAGAPAAGEELLNQNELDSSGVLVSNS